MMTVQSKMLSLMGRVHDQFGHNNPFLILELSVESAQFKPRNLLDWGSNFSSLWILVCIPCGQRADVAQQLVAVLRSPVLLNHCLHLFLQQPRVDRAAFLQDVWVHRTKGTI